MPCWTPPARCRGVPPQKGQHLWPWGLHPLLESENTSKPVATSSQASPQAAMPDDTKPIDKTSEGVSAPTTPLTKTPRADTGILPKEMLLLQEEMNRTMGCLLMTRSSLDAHQRKQLSISM